MKPILLALVILAQGCAIVRHEWSNGTVQSKTTIVVPMGSKLKSVIRELEKPRGP